MVWMYRILHKFSIINLAQTQYFVQSAKLYSNFVCLAWKKILTSLTSSSDFDSVVLKNCLCDIVGCLLIVDVDFGAYHLKYRKEKQIDLTWQHTMHFFSFTFNSLSLCLFLSQFAVYHTLSSSVLMAVTVDDWFY